jgi:hypothetical protein
MDMGDQIREQMGEQRSEHIEECIDERGQESDKI